jgi:hypothetical protein
MMTQTTWRYSPDPVLRPHGEATTSALLVVVLAEFVAVPPVVADVVDGEDPAEEHPASATSTARTAAALDVPRPLTQVRYDQPSPPQQFAAPP